jgi:uncharacterized protein (TIGR02186 family)
MKVLQKTLFLTFILLVFHAGTRSSLAIESEGPTVRLTPGVIEMGASYSGAAMRIEGAAKAGAEVVVVVRGADREEIFNKKGRFGPIWINAGKVHVSGVPSLYLCFSARPVHAFLSRDAIDRHQLDETAIRRQMRISPQGDVQEQNVIRNNYLTLKRQEGTYRVSNAALKKADGDPGALAYSVEFTWPKKAPPGAYQVKVYECRDRSVVRLSSAPLEVVKVGFPARLSSLAMNQAALYGVLAVLAAAIAGFGIDFVATKLFGKKRAVGH